MVNPEEVLQSLDEFSKLKPKDIPRELEEYLMYVAKTGDPVYQWPMVKCLFREKMLNVITDFYESCPSMDLPPCPNVDPFNYETMKASLLERLEAFSNAPFTVQRICELLTTPRKEYTRVDKFMRAIEKNILVVSTKEPGGSRARPDAPPLQSPADVLMNGVMDGRGAGGLAIGEAIETVSAEGVNLLHGGEAAAAAQATDVALADSIRVECEDIEMDDGTSATAVVWDTKAGGECGGGIAAADSLKALTVASAATVAASGAAVVWDGKAEECGVNGEEGLKIMDTPPEATAAVVWDTKDPECGESLKTLSPTPESAPTAADPPVASKPAEDEHEAAAVAVVSEFLTPNREVFGQGVELSGGVENVPLALASGPDPEPRSAGVASGVTADCTVQVANNELSPVVTETVPKVEESQPQEQVSEADSKAATESKESESEDTSQVDAESGISCSADSSSASSDCATAEMNQTLETNGTLEITSVESEVMSPLDGLEDVTANISPPSPDTGATLEDGETTPPPTFAEMTADEDTQDAVRSNDPPDDEADGELEELKAETGTKLSCTPEPVVPLVPFETKMEVDETPVMEDTQAEEPVVEQCVLEVPAEAVELQSQTSSQEENPPEQADSSVLPYNIV